ncbi:TonB-dependent receptor [Xylophilus sp.]|uniref:TonB-dependent receptor n=1 Tax=Xylophilus sp. TaxID=2653893 RepID=UPI0013BABC67|nr:TonB-dependent receptor [Xylophilus sp.]KAF1046761.1 MAG: Pesticin receptor [Xylophilus sp.]
MRAQLLWKPHADFDLRLAADYGDIHTNPASVLLQAADSYITAANKVGSYPLVGGVNVDIESYTDLKQGGVSATANWRLDGGYNLRSTTSARYFGYKPVIADNYDVALYSNQGTSYRDRIWQQEIRLDSPRGEKFDYAIGAIYWGENLDTYVRNAYTGNSLNGSGYVNRVVERTGTLDDRVFSLFAQGTWHLGSRLELTAGLRLSQERKAGSFVRVGRAGFSSDLVQTRVLPAGLVSLNYWLQPDVQAYATVGYGEKSGGLNISSGAANAAGRDTLYVDPESARSAEVGLKGTWLDQRLTAGVALFWSEIRNFQASAYDEVSDSSYLTNAGTVRSRGVSSNVRFRPAEGWTLGLASTLLDASYLSYENGSCPPENGATSCSHTGERTLRSPRIAYNVSSRYEWNIASAGGLGAFVQGRWSYRSWVYSTVDNSNYTRIPGYGLLSLSTGVNGRHADNRWSLTLSLSNALDKRYYRVLRGGPTVFGTLGTPRTLSASFRYDF